MKLGLCLSNFQAEHLCNIMSEFDPRSEFLKMRVDPKEKVLSMAAKSNILQEFAVDVPSQSDIVQSFQVGMRDLELPLPNLSISIFDMKKKMCILKWIAYN